MRIQIISCTHYVYIVLYILYLCKYVLYVCMYIWVLTEETHITVKNVPALGQIDGLTAFTSNIIQ